MIEEINSKCIDDEGQEHSEHDYRHNIGNRVPGKFTYYACHWCHKLRDDYEKTSNNKTEEKQYKTSDKTMDKPEKRTSDKLRGKTHD